MLHRLREFLARPAAYGALLLGYLGIIAAVAYAASTGAASQESVRAEALRETGRNAAIIKRVDREAEVRTEGFCIVIINSHAATRDDLTRLDNSIRAARDFIRNADGETPALVALARQGLPRTIAARKTTRERLRALTPPTYCKPYMRQTLHGEK